MSKRLSASIVVYKSNPRLLRDAIESFLAAAPGSDLYIIDNSPTNEAKAHCDYPGTLYFFNGFNMGFGAAHNLALKKALESQSEYHLVLNPDIYFGPEAVQQLTDFMDTNKDVGLVMPKILYPDGRLQYLCRLLPSPTMLLMRRFLHPFKKVSSKINHQYEMHFSGYDQVMDVPFLSGCFMFLRVDSLRSTGLFDESIFLYTEDIDLSRRLHRQYRTVFFPGATVYHHHVRESYRNLRVFVHHTRSAITYFNKWGWFTDSERERINRKIILKLARGSQ
ncbi:MAG TPA: glycosyltransferase family 2 protein [Cyclobacteriaceae bacterium]|nr:glycosyltransferase family 2 protein [Cyclobacteriaceae bacterium]